MNVLDKNAEKYNTFSIPIEKEVKNIDKNGNESVGTISYKIKFIDSARFMANSLSNFLDYLAEGIHKIKWKDYGCFLEYESVNDNSIKYKCLSCNKDYSNKLDKKIDLRTLLSFHIMTSINLFCYHLSIWMNG